MRAVHVFEHHALVFRRGWRSSVFATVASPILYLLVVGVGIGRMVDTGVDDITYLAFLAPGLLAAQAMQTATIGSSYPIVAGMRWTRAFQGMTRTPLRPLDLMLGHLLWVTAHLVLVGVPLLIVMMLMGVMAPLNAIAMLPVAVLTGVAFAAPISAWSVTVDRDIYVSALSRFVIVPMFLFCGVFFPISVLPPILQPIAALTPLWNGAELLRMIAAGAIDPLAAAAHLLVLAVTIAAGLGAAAYTFRAQLEV